MTDLLLEQELQQVNSQIQELGALVHTALGRALVTLEKRDIVQARTLIEADEQMDQMQIQIEGEALRLLAWQQPLSKQNLRYLLSVLIIANSLERVGDGAAGISKLLLDMPFGNADFNDRAVDTQGYLSEVTILRGILDLGNEALRVLQGTMQAFAERNVKTARYLWQEDDVVDVRYHMVRHDLMNIMAGNQALKALHYDPNILQRATYLLWIAHKLERVADHCTNICERIVFIIEGGNTITYDDDH